MQFQMISLVFSQSTHQERQ